MRADRPQSILLRRHVAIAEEFCGWCMSQSSVEHVIILPIPVLLRIFSAIAAQPVSTAEKSKSQHWAIIVCGELTMTTTSLKPSHRTFQEELQSNPRQALPALEPLGKHGWAVRVNKDVTTPTTLEAEALQTGLQKYVENCFNGALHLSGAVLWNQVTMPYWQPDWQAPALNGYNNFVAISPSQPTQEAKGHQFSKSPTFVTAVTAESKPTQVWPSSFLADVKIGSAASTEVNCDLSLPVIDLSDLRSGDPVARKRIVREVGNATEEWGFFQVVNHSVPDELVERMYNQAQRFFNLPRHVKELSEIVGPNRRCLGYKGTFEAPEQNISIKESLADFRSPEAPVANQAAKVWPEEGNPAFSKTVQEHFDAVGALGLELLDLLAESLGLQRTFFSRHFQPGSDCIGTWRLHHFPPNKTPSHVWRTAPHSDPSVLTILKQDVGGLQVKQPKMMEGGRPVVNGTSLVEGDVWINVKPLPDSFVVNVGDILEAWSNGRFPSVEHRVALRENCERFSTVHFLDAGPSLHIEAPPELIDDAHPSRFKPFVAGDYRTNFEATKRQGDIRKGMALDYVRRTPIHKH